MQTCPACHRSLPEINRFCTNCGRQLDGDASTISPSRPHTPESEQLNINVLYGMVVALAAALLFPPWETPPNQQPEFLGFSFILFPPSPEAIVSPMLLTIELVTLTIAGLYGAFLLRRKP